MKDYTGKLNDHEEYKKVIEALEKTCKYLEYVIIEEDTFIKTFENLILSKKLKNKWWGTKSSQKRIVYRLKAAPEIFRHLKKIETFCKYKISMEGDFVEETNFGCNDIAFFDDQEIPLLFTTTHEVYILLREDFYKER